MQSQGKDLEECLGKIKWRQSASNFCISGIQAYREYEDDNGDGLKGLFNTVPTLRAESNMTSFPPSAISLLLFLYPVGPLLAKCNQLPM